MKKILLCFFLIFASFIYGGEELKPDLSLTTPIVHFFEETPKEKASHKEGEAFVIDLSEFGFEKKYYLLTVGHLCRKDEKKDIWDFDKIIAKHKPHSVCKVISISKEFDVALIECDADFQNGYKLPDENYRSSIGDEVYLLGYYQGVVKAYGGYIRKKGEAFVEYYKLGFSGSPMLFKKSLFLAGMSHIGMVEEYDNKGVPIRVKPNWCGYVRYQDIRNFIIETKKKYKGETLVLK